MPGGEFISRLQLYVLAGLDEDLPDDLGYIDALDHDQVETLIAQAAYHSNVKTFKDVVQAISSSRWASILGPSSFYGIIGSVRQPKEKICFLQDLGLSPFEPIENQVSILDSAVVMNDILSLEVLVSLLDPIDASSTELVSRAKELARQQASPTRTVLDQWRTIAETDVCATYQLPQ
jgi:hypothetical protein